MPTNLRLVKTTKQHYRVDRREIAFVRFILEAYDGLAIVTTLDPETGLIEFQIAPGCEQDVETQGWLDEEDFRKNGGVMNHETVESMAKRRKPFTVDYTGFGWRQRTPTSPAPSCAAAVVVEGPGEPIEQAEVGR